MADALAPFVVRLRRQQTSTQWGFKMQGGREHGLPLFIQKVQPKSVAEKRGLVAGDLILAICNVPSANLTHEQAKMEILRAGNELDFVVQRGAIDVSHPAFGIQQPSPAPRSEVDDKSQLQHHTPFRHVQSRSFQILSQQLQESEQGGSAPSAVTDKPADERPSYLQAHEPSFQKIYGEQ